MTSARQNHASVLVLTLAYTVSMHLNSVAKYFDAIILTQSISFVNKKQKTQCVITEKMRGKKHFNNGKTKSSTLG